MNFKSVYTCLQKLFKQKPYCLGYSNPPRPFPNKELEYRKSITLSKEEILKRLRELDGKAARNEDGI